MSKLPEKKRNSLLINKITKVTLGAAMLASPLVAHTQPVNAALSSAPVSSLASKLALNTHEAEAFFDRFFASPKSKAQYAGAAVVVVKDGKVVIQKGYGYSDKDKKTPVDVQKTVFRLASVSKSFTAVALMQLVEQGTVDLKQDIRSYIGDLPLSNPFSTPVTIEHLLTHTTGFENREVRDEDVYYDLDKVVSLKDYIRETMPPVVREPGTSYMYDNFASMLQGYIVERVSGMPFEEYMDKNLFKGLGMNSSGFLLKGNVKDRLAAGYDGSGNPVPIYAMSPTVMPDGGMLSTPEDIGKFMLAFLDENASKKGRILSTNSVKEMSIYRSAIHPLLPDTTYGFEAAVPLPGAGSSDRVITKEGGLFDSSAYIWFIPEQRLGVFFVCNQASQLQHSLYTAFMDSFFPEYGKPAVLQHTVPAASEQDYSGLYINLRAKGLVSTVSISADGKLSAYNALQRKQTMKQVAPGLYISDNRMFTAFQKDPNGRVYMKLSESTGDYSIKAEVGKGFKDVDSNHPYARYIIGLQSVGLYDDDASQAFLPEQGVTRGEYIRNLLTMSGVSESKNPIQFKDAVNDPNGPYIQAGKELGFVVGTKDYAFESDKEITRQEAALILWRVISSKYSEKGNEKVKIAGKTDSWALKAVQLMARLKFYGPDIRELSDGTIDFRSTDVLTRKEEACLLFNALTQPPE
ncbi:serine hydrolase [Paenibacillus sp. MER TA 81-3]|uniref:serine hydrolase n=1 Tax=Paenibacillus sp. MER TA 81-3 TaxID=2939573 RepID=UPI00203F9B9A|nr:serine hydrolase [Paenibacillus sp. MER TA 81-3]MCM3340563.1 serine hydrolase [Paenibacillus sp. MER TA 81-3]